MERKSKALERIKIGDMIVISRFNNARVWVGKGQPVGYAINDAKRGEIVRWITEAVSIIVATEPLNAGVYVTSDGKKAK